jgi:hypothetical protein
VRGRAAPRMGPSGAVRPSPLQPDALRYRSFPRFSCLFFENDVSCAAVVVVWHLGNAPLTWINARALLREGLPPINRMIAMCHAIAPYLQPSLCSCCTARQLHSRSQPRGREEGGLPRVNQVVLGFVHRDEEGVVVHAVQGLGRRRRVRSPGARLHKKTGG